MVLNRILASMLVVGMVAGCSSLEERQRANGNYEYVDEQASARLKIPDGVDEPEFGSDFVIPEIGDEARRDLIGEAVTIVAPSLVLPTVSGSHIEEGRREATVWFDQVDDKEPLARTVWGSLVSFLEARDIAISSFDQSKGRLITDWMIIESSGDGKWYTWTSTERSIGRRFEFQLDVKPHGRTAELKVKLKDYLETVDDEVIADLDADEIRRNEVEILNQVIDHYDTKLRIADAKRIRRIQTGLDLELGFNADGDPAYLVESDYNIAWPRLLLVLKKMGFNVKDLDKSNGLLFVQYVGADVGWWSKLWGNDDKNQLPLDKTDYRIQVKEQGPKISITLLDDDNNQLSAQTVTEIYEPLAKVMATNDLDI